jgi:flavin reductase (DIM6/NTAB) family NADH-FMN oxidoreductase RutF
MIAVNIGHNATGLRDTGINIQRTGEFVVNIANHSLLNALHASSAVYAPDESEVEALSLATVKSATVAPPRIRVAPACMECVLHQSMTLGRKGVSLFIGEVTRFFVKDDLIANGKIATAALDPVARIGGPNYATLGKLITLPEAIPHRPRAPHISSAG